MIKNIAVAALVLSVSVAACAQVDKPRETARPKADAKLLAPDCPASETVCRLEVRVGPNCAISVHPNERRYAVAFRERGVEMLWTIRGDATFDKSKGIRFTSPDFPLAKKNDYSGLSNPEGVFLKSNVKIASDQEFRLFNRGRPGYYYYAINVIQGGKACREFDPGIANQEPTP